jgi:hypothetical protein
MLSKIALAVSMIAVIGLAFVGIGMAYTSSTENSGNELSSEYVVLEQNNYSFGTNSALKFNTVTTKTGSTYIASGMNEPFTLGGVSYKGIKVGSPDLLKAVKVGTPEVTLKVYVQTFGGGFRDFHSYDDGWRYILRITDSTNPSNVQYAVYDGSPVDHTTNVSEWAYYDKDGVATNFLAIRPYTDQDQATYTTELFFAGKVQITKVQSSAKPVDKDGVIIDSGTIKFFYDSGRESQ